MVKDVAEYFKVRSLTIKGTTKNSENAFARDGWMSLPIDPVQENVKDMDNKNTEHTRRSINYYAKQSWDLIPSLVSKMAVREPRCPKMILVSETETEAKRQSNESTDQKYELQERSLRMKTLR